MYPVNAQNGIEIINPSNIPLTYGINLYRLVSLQSSVLRFPFDTKYIIGIINNGGITEHNNIDISTHTILYLFSDLL